MHEAGLLTPAGRQRSNPDEECTVPWYTSRVSVASGNADPEVCLNVRVGNEDVAASRVGNVDMWPPHEGCGSRPSSACLRRRIFEVAANVDLDELTDMVEFVNRVLLHECSSYCLRICKRGEGDNAQVRFMCRMRFGEENRQVDARTYGKPARKDPGLVTHKGITYLECERDHPRVVQGIHRLAPAWGGNYDLQPVLALHDDTQPLDLGISFTEWVQVQQEAADQEDDGLRKARLQELVDMHANPSRGG